jgi:hypothetical protein
LKFGAVIVIFNILVLCFLGVVFGIPVIMLGPADAAVFWRGAWLLGPLALFLAGAVDCYFLANRGVYRLLQKEDWPALIQELETRVIRKGGYPPHLVKLLANTYLVLSDARGVTELEKKLEMNKPALIRKNALIFGTARILTGDLTGAARFFASRLEEGGRSPWLSWYHGFALLLDRQFAAAAREFSLLAEESPDGIITGLSSWFLGDTLDKFLPEKGLYRLAEAGRARVLKAFKRRFDWNREIKAIETEVFAAVLSSYINKAADFIYQ